MTQIWLQCTPNCKSGFNASQITDMITNALQTKFVWLFREMGGDIIVLHKVWEKGVTVDDGLLGTINAHNRCV